MRYGGFWVSPEGRLFDIGDRFHEEFAESISKVSFKEAIEMGWVRIRAYGQYHVPHLIVHGTAAGIEGAKSTILETWGNDPADIQAQIEPIGGGFAAYSTIPPEEFYEADIDNLAWAARMIEARRRPKPPRQVHIRKHVRGGDKT